MLPSLPPLIRTAPVGLHTTASTIALGSLQAYRRSPPGTSQTMSSPLPLLPPPLASRVPSGLQATMPLQRSSKPAVGGLPQAHAAIIAATGQLGAVRTPRHTTDPGWLRTAHPPAGAGGHLPHVQSLLIARTGQKLPIRTPRHAIEEGVDVVRVPQNLPSFSRGRVPQPDGIV